MLIKDVAPLKNNKIGRLTQEEQPIGVFSEQHKI
jgi:hypothetical protein